MNVYSYVSIRAVCLIETAMHKEGYIMAVTGKTGADAVFLALKHICKVITRYRLKLDAVIDQAESAGVITSGQATDAHAFVAAANATCAVFELIADYSGF